ncbi:hypothetical protein [Lentilactobacillus farraginis]|uniref:Uncharacterized protein n=1 Tax=Lentilactobacillus farraginis DSM 18382 = JCM 14108 TaxID=1423743 RepID=X0PC38_9LACO|nr:hypothetical protein [Lentilactobacillus farraginis]KRM03771.1 hypothetical protein FD41_GL001016 [Lentilactobacillus farraginis DSM 18382 = JCM 14108]GAF37778.1 hypothetical protein JCM14108_2838 [Lentilactobacillus farraginis DSM 18382 = JCM 14108]
MKTHTYLDLSDDERMTLLQGALEDLENVLGTTPLTPISANLLCLKYGISPHTRDKMMLAFNRLSEDHKLNTSYFPEYRKVVEKYVTTNNPDQITMKFLSSFANFPVYQLQGLANHIQSYFETELSNK